MTLDEAIAAIMARKTAASGHAIFIDAFILRKILEQLK